MVVEHAFRVTASPLSAREGARLHFLARGYRETPAALSGGSGQEPARFRRGTWRARLFSLRAESWPHSVTVLVVPVSGEETGVHVRFEVSSGAHLVGALERATFEAEAVAFEETLMSGRRSAAPAALDAVRRPVSVAITLNMLLAATLVAFIGSLGGYPLFWVGVAATLVALLDGLVVAAFADVILAGSRRYYSEVFRARDDLVRPGGGESQDPAGDARRDARAPRAP